MHGGALLRKSDIRDDFIKQNIYQDKYFTSATCVSDYCDYYAIEKKLWIL